MPEMPDRRRRLLSGQASVKDDLQEIFATSESSFSYIKELVTTTSEIEKNLSDLHRMLNEYVKDDETQTDDGRTKLNQIAEFCSSISESFETLVDTLTTDSNSHMEETKKNRNAILSLANTYKAVADLLHGIKASLDEAMAQRKDIDRIVKEASAKIELITVALENQSPITLFFKNIREDEISSILPKLTIVVDEILKDKGFDSSGKKKEPFIILTNLIWTQIKASIVHLLALGLITMLLNSWLKTHSENLDKVTTGVYETKIQELNKKLEQKEEVNRALTDRLTEVESRKSSNKSR